MPLLPDDTVASVERYSELRKASRDLTQQARELIVTAKEAIAHARAIVRQVHSNGGESESHRRTSVG